MTFAYFTLLIFILLNLFCAAYAKKSAGFTPANNREPRDFLAKTTGKAARANAAQQNGYETFGAYAAAVIVAHATGEASLGVINFWAFVFIVSRFLFIWCYIQDKSLMRSAMWAIGLFSIISLFIAAI